MKSIISIFVFSTFSLLIAGSTQSDVNSRKNIDVKELVRRVEMQYMGKTSHAITQMNIITESWSRSITLEMWSEGRDKMVAVIVKPKKEQGTATLKINDDIWNYLPKIDRLIKIPSSLMGDSWMGSHLTNDDLVKENKIDELYNLTLDYAHGDSAMITCIPKPDAAVVWGRIDYLMNIEKLIPIQVFYYDEDNSLVRTISFDEVKIISGRWVPLRMVVTPEDKPKEMTEVVYQILEFTVSLDKDQFTVSALRRGK